MFAWGDGRRWQQQPSANCHHLAGDVLPNWNVSASYSHSRSEKADGTRQLTHHPMDTVKLWNTYAFSGELENLTVGGGVRWVSKTAVDYRPYLNGKAVQDDYAVAVADAMARYKFNDYVSAALNVNNQFDKKYYAAFQTLAYGYCGEPRNATLTVKYDFEGEGQQCNAAGLGLAYCVCA